MSVGHDASPTLNILLLFSYWFKNILADISGLGTYFSKPIVTGKLNFPALKVALICCCTPGHSNRFLHIIVIFHSKRSCKDISLLFTTACLLETDLSPPSQEFLEVWGYWVGIWNNQEWGCKQIIWGISKLGDNILYSSKKLLVFGGHCAKNI